MRLRKDGKKKRDIRTINSWNRIHKFWWKEKLRILPPYKIHIIQIISFKGPPNQPFLRKVYKLVAYIPYSEKEPF